MLGCVLGGERHSAEQEGSAKTDIPIGLLCTVNPANRL